MSSSFFFSCAFFIFLGLLLTISCFWLLFFFTNILIFILCFFLFFARFSTLLIFWCWFTTSLFIFLGSSTFLKLLKTFRNMRFLIFIFFVWSPYMQVIYSLHKWLYPFSHVLNNTCLNNFARIWLIFLQNINYSSHW